MSEKKSTAVSLRSELIDELQLIVDTHPELYRSVSDLVHSSISRHIKGIANEKIVNLQPSVRLEMDRILEQYPFEDLDELINDACRQLTLQYPSREN